MNKSISSQLYSFIREDIAADTTYDVNENFYVHAKNPKWVCGTMLITPLLIFFPRPC